MPGPTPSPPRSDAPALITGLGLVTPLGFSAWQTLAALLAGRTTADRLAALPDDVDPVALARATGGSAFAPFSSTDPAVDLAERAAREAMLNAWPETPAPGGLRTIVASSKGALHALLDARTPARRAACVVLTPHGYLCNHLRARLGLGPTTAVVAACATALFALEQALWIIRRAEAQRVLIVAVESALLPLFVHAYRRLGVLAPISPPAGHVARPLDRGRNGFTLCECAAAIVLESPDAPGASARAKAVLRAVATGTQPDDMVRAPERFTTLERLVRRVAPPEAPVALLHAHATGTRDNDERELASLAAALGERARTTPVYASKGAIGHPLGAAALVNIVLGCLFARAGRRPPMPWLREPIDTPFPLTGDEEPIAPGPQLCIAAGFGGHVGAACFTPRTLRA